MDKSSRFLLCRLGVRVPPVVPIYKGVKMKKTLGQTLHNERYSNSRWNVLTDYERMLWEESAKKLAADFDSIRLTTNCNDEQTDDSSGVPMNVDTRY